MPCDTITTAKLDLTKADADVLKSALTSLGFEINRASMDEIVASNYNTDVTWNRARGLTVRTSGNAERWADKIQSAYTSQVVQTVGKRYGWQVKQITSEQYQVIRR